MLLRCVICAATAAAFLVEARKSVRGLRPLEAAPEPPLVDPEVQAQLDREALELATQSAQADGGVIIVTTSNSGYVELTLNLFASMQRVSRERLFVFCEDPACVSLLKKKAGRSGNGSKGNGLHAFHLSGRSIAFPSSFNDPLFNTVTAGKLQYLPWFLSHHFTVLFTDSDVAWLSDPLPELTRFSRTSMVIQDDTPLEWGAETTPLEDRHYPCTGFFLLRPTPLADLLLRRWKNATFARVDWPPQDQIEGEKVLKSTCKRWCVDELGDCNERSECRTLARSSFPNGHTVMHWQGGNWTVPTGASPAAASGLASTRRNGGTADQAASPPPQPPAPEIVHANWLEGVQAKQAMLRKHGAWYLR